MELRPWKRTEGIGSTILMGMKCFNRSIDVGVMSQVWFFREAQVSKGLRKFDDKTGFNNHSFSDSSSLLSRTVAKDPLEIADMTIVPASRDAEGTTIEPV
jgi:hypothetical protein